MAADGPGFPRESGLLAGLPAPDRFLTVDELEASTDRQLADLPGLCSWVCGHDADGREMRCLEAGDGPRRALLLGHVHPEEPVGTLLLESELPSVDTLGDGIYGAVTVAAEIDYLTSQLGGSEVPVSAGCDADEYAMKRWGSHVVLAEVPCFTSDQVADTTPAGLTRGEAKLAGIAREEELVAWLRPRYEQARGLLEAGSPWQRAVSGYLADAARDLPAETQQARSEPAFGGEATVAQCFDSLYNRELLALCRLGQFGRMVAVEAGRDARLAALAGEVDARLGERLAAVVQAAALRPVAIRSRLQMQLGALLASMAYVAGRRAAARS